MMLQVQSFMHFSPIKCDFLPYLSNNFGLIINLQSKADYLSLLSRRLLREMETLGHPEEHKTVTKIEVEVIEDVTKILKTYIVGERNDLLQDQALDQATVDATDEFTTGRYRYESTSAAEALIPSYELTEKEYVDVLEKELEISRPPSDIRLLSEGQHYEGHSEIRTRKSVESETTTTSESIVAHGYVPSYCEHVYVECKLKRTEDYSLNEVNVAMPNVFSAVLSLIRERIVQQLPQFASYGMEQQRKQYTSETTTQRVPRFQFAKSKELMATTTKTVETKKEPSFLFEKPQLIEPIKIPELNIMELEIRRMADTSAISANFAIPRTGQSQLDIEHHYEYHKARGETYGLQQQGQHYEGETVIRETQHFFTSESKESSLEERTTQKQREVEMTAEQVGEQINQITPTFYEMEVHGQHYKGESRLQYIRHLSSESVEEEESLGGPTSIDLVKKEARGEFEVVIVISNDQRGSPKSFRENETPQAISFVAQVSTEGKKEEVLATVATKNTWKEMYKGYELSEETVSVAVAVQKTLQSDDIIQHRIRNWDDKAIERTGRRCRECGEEKAVIMYSLQSETKRGAEIAIVQTEKHSELLQYFTSATEKEFTQVSVTLMSSVTAIQEASCTRAASNSSHTSFSCGAFYTEDTTAVIYMQNILSTALMMSSDYIRKAPRKSFGHVLRTVATKAETVNAEIGMEHMAMYSNDLAAETSVSEKLAESSLLRSRESRETEHTSNVALNQGAKTLAASVKLLAKRKQAEQMTLAEFGDEREQVAVMLQCGGRAAGQAQHDWPLAVTGRSSTKTTSTTTTNTSSSNTFEHFSNYWGTTDDFLGTGLTTGTCTSTSSHLPNFKTLLPARGAAQTVIPIAGTSSVSADLFTDCSTQQQEQQISPPMGEIRVNIVHELRSVDVEQQLFEEEWKRLEEQRRGNEYFGRDAFDRKFEEKFHSHQVDRGICAHEASTLVEPRYSSPYNGPSSEAEAISLSLPAADQYTQQSTMGLLPPSEDYLSRDTFIQQRKVKEQIIGSLIINEMPITHFNETTSQVNGLAREVPIQRMPLSEELRKVPIERISSSAALMNHSVTPGHQFSDVQESRIAKIGASLRSIETGSLFSLGSVDSNAPTGRPYRSTEFVNEGKTEEFFWESGFRLETTSLNANQWKAAMLECEGTPEIPTGLGYTTGSHGHRERNEESRRRNTQKIFNSPNEIEQGTSHYTENIRESTKIQAHEKTEGVRCACKGNFIRTEAEKEESRERLHSNASEKRVAMLRAGFDLSTTLLTTPDAGRDQMFTKDRSMTTSEYFSDEQSSSTMAETYQKQHKTRVERTSQSLDDVRETFQNDRAFDEVSHISDVSHCRIGHMGMAADREATVGQMGYSSGRFQTTTGEELHAKAWDEYPHAPETYEQDIAFGRSEQYETSSMTYLTGYHELREEIQAAEKAGEVVVVKLAEKPNIDEGKKAEEDSNLMLSWEQDGGVQVSLKDHKQQHETLQTGAYKTEIIGNTKQLISGAEQLACTPLVNMAVAETPKQQTQLNVRKVDYHQTVAQVTEIVSSSCQKIISDAAKFVSATFVDEEDSSSVGASFSKAERPPKEASSGKILPATRMLKTALEMATTVSEDTEEQLRIEENAAQYDTTAQLPLQPRDMSFFQTKEDTLTRVEIHKDIDEMRAPSSLKASVRERQEASVRVSRETQQHTLTQFETVERDASTVGIFRESEFMEEMKQMKMMSAEAVKMEQSLRGSENEEAANMVQEVFLRAREEGAWTIEKKEIESKLIKEGNKEEYAGAVPKRQETSSAGNFAEYKSAETQVGGQFYQIERKREKADAENIIQIGRELYTEAKLPESSLKKSQTALEVMKGTTAESAFIQPTATSFTQASLTVSVTQEVDLTQTAELKHMFDSTAHAGSHLEAKSVEAAHANFTEMEEEQCSVTTDYRTIVREASAERSITEKNSSAAELVLRAAQKEDVEIANIFTKSGALSDIGINFRTRETAAVAKDFRISEEHGENLFQKLEEQNESTATLDSTSKEAIAAWAVEYGHKKTSSSGSFRQVEVREAAEQSTKTTASKFAYQIAPDTHFASTENVTQESVLETFSNVQKTSKTVPKGITDQAQMALKSPFENSIKHVFNLEKHQETVSASSKRIASGVMKESSATCVEIGLEEESLVAGLSKVLRTAAVKKLLASAMTEKKQLSTTATMERDTEYTQTIQKPEESFRIEECRSLKQIAVLQKQLAISLEVREGIFDKKSVAETCVTVMPDTEIIPVHGQAVQYGAALVAFSGSFMKLQQKETKEEAEIQVAVFMKLKSRLDLQSASSELTTVHEELTKERVTDFVEAQSIMQKALAFGISNLKVTHEEEVEASTSAFEVKEEHLSSEHRFINKISEAVSSQFQESSDEKQHFVAYWDTVQNEMSAEALFAVANLRSEIRSVGAVKEENVELMKQEKYSELIESTKKTLLVKPYASEDRKWKIVQGRTEGIFKRLEEEVEEEVTVDIGRSAKEKGIFHEFGSVDVETIGHFARITVKRVEKEEASVSYKTGREWEECLKLEASKENTESLERLISKVEQKEVTQRSFCKAVREAIDLMLMATLKTDVMCMMTFAQQEESHTCDFIMKSKNVDSVSNVTYVAQSEAALVDATWTTVISELDTEINVRDVHRERAVLATAASRELLWGSEATLCMQPSHESASAQLHEITALSGVVRQFRIESSEIQESILERQAEELHVEGTCKTVICAEGVAESVAESSEAQASAGILLMRRAAQKATQAAMHVVSIALVLKQELKTQYAEETSNETSIELSVKAPPVDVNETRQVIHRETISLKAQSAKKSSLQKTVGLIKSRELVAAAKNVLKEARKEAIVEKMKEADSEGFDILSQWTTVYRDLEASISLQRALNVASVFSTVATCEEETEITETWAAREFIAETKMSRATIVLESCQREFQIAYDELKIRMEKYEKEENCWKIWKDKNSDVLLETLRESVTEKLNAVINLHRVPNILPKKTANECVWHEPLLISAVPLYIKSEDIESDFVSMDIVLGKEAAQMWQETLRTAANCGEAQLFESEEAGDEKMKIVIQIQAKQLAHLALETIWPEARKSDAISTVIQEYLEDQAALYAQITSEQVTFGDSAVCIYISRIYEPQILMANASKEEILDKYEEFGEIQQAETTSHVVAIGNKGECLSMCLQETEENFVSVGFQYFEDEQASSAESSLVETRFGGDYQFATKATQIEYRNTAMMMTRRSENEIVRKKLKEKMKSSVLVDVLASTSEATSVDICLEKMQQAETISLKRYCPRTEETVRRLLETSEAIHTTYAQFKIKGASYSTSIVLKLPIYGGHHMLSTDSAEESVIVREIEFYKAERFEEVALTLQQALTAITPILMTQQTTEETAQISTDCVKPVSVGTIQLFRKCANRAPSIKAKFFETTDVRLCSYLQFTRENERSELEKIVQEFRFGGRLYLSTGAAEEYELNAVRELVSNSLRIAHCSHVIASRKWSRGTSYKTIAFSSESADMLAVLRHPECSSSASSAMLEKTWLRSNMTLHESAAVTLTTNLSYANENQRKVAEKTVRLARDGGSFLLVTPSVTEEQKLVQWTVEKRRDTLLGTSKKISVVVREKSAPLETNQSESVELSTYACLGRSSEKFEARKIIVAANRGDSMNWNLFETLELNEFSNYQFTQVDVKEHTEKILRQTLYGGHLCFETLSSKEHTVEIVLQLSSKHPTDAKAYFSMEISNKSIPYLLSTKSAVLVESNQVEVLERKLGAESIMITRKAINTCVAQFTTTESTLETETITVWYQRSEQSQEIEKKVLEAFYGGQQKLETGAVEENTIDMHVELISKRLTSTDTRFHKRIANAAAPCVKSTRSSVIVDNSREYRLHKARLLESQTSAAIPVGNYESTRLFTSESTSETECITTQWERREAAEKVSFCVIEKRFGGALVLFTGFAQQFDVTFTASLSASRCYFESTTHTRRITRTTEKPSLTTPHTTKVITEIDCLLNRLSSGDLSETTIRTANQCEAMLVGLTESTQVFEIINIHYERRNAMDEFSEVFPEARFGGAQFLSTSSVQESKINFTASLSASKSFFESATFTLQVARTTEKPTLAATCATEVLTAISYTLNGPSSANRSEVIIRTANWGEAVLVQLNESTAVFETIHTQYERQQTASEVSEIFPEARFGGSLILSTSFAQESKINFMTALSASRSFFESTTCTRQMARTTEKPALVTSYTTELSAEINCTLNRPPFGDWFEVTVRTANWGESVLARLTESTAIFETINIQFEQQQAIGRFSEVFPEARFGGSLILNTSATVEVSIDKQFPLSARRFEQYAVEVVSLEKNRIYERYRTLEVSDESVTASAQLQKVNDSFRVVAMKRAGHTDETHVTVAESSEINEFNNFMLKNVTETSARREATLKEALFGGRLELSTGHATEQTVKVSSTMHRASDIFNITASKKTENRGESISITCSASEESRLFAVLELQSNKLAYFELTDTRKAPNRLSSEQLDTYESREMVMVLNVAMQKTLGYESTQFIQKDKQRGGKLELLCNASREAYAQLYQCLESSLPLKQHAGMTLTFPEILHGEHVTMKLMATEETIFNAEVSFEKQGFEATKIYKGKEASKDLPQILETLESLETAVEVRDTEVRRRLSEMHVESALELAARECSPVSLQTDFVEQTVIRHEAELRVDAERTVGFVEVEKSSATIEREELLCTEAVDVTLRHEEEEHEELREEKTEKRLVFCKGSSKLSFLKVRR